ncbi:SepM family pheromone-processing serine protease [Apilactobacillus ozensis]|uniref:SepM family pheromone-processing serine protease n=1 Tax=Apilactobacillus ozensis TaxID=866801 RepID=UPI00200B74C7|nr:SepM family pheromone-processing serine protease [Apilactobacillus ozensis]MCK8607321.1 PDZ domain-containing protein [Apilactobacillus ozensis]
MIKFIKKHKLGLSVIIAALLAILFFLPIPYYVEKPGDSSNLSKIVNIKNNPDKHAGKFMLTSVAIEPLTPAKYIYDKFVPYYSIDSINNLTDGQSDDEYNKVQNFYMLSSINSAIYNAYKKADKEVESKYNGIYVLGLHKSSFAKYLKVGDTIISVDGKKFNNSESYRNYIFSKKIGEKITIQYLQNNKLKKATAPTIKLPGTNHSGIGIILTDDFSVKTKIPIKVNPGDVGGPSGGLMFALQIYSQLTGENIRKNMNVAGTGTISPNGAVGEIGGVDKKIIAAKNNGAKIFLAPYLKSTKSVLKVEPNHKTNYELAVLTAKKYAPDMKVIPVTSFEDAINKLNNLK